MTPIVPDVLNELAQLLARCAQPDADPAERSASLGMSALLLGIAAQEWDRAADRLVEENAALRRLFSRALPHLGQGSISQRLEGLAQAQEPDFRISTLETANSALRDALIDLHVAVEALDDPAARSLEAEIWGELARSTERRLLAGSPV